MFESILNFTYYMLTLTTEYEVLSMFWYFLIICSILSIFRQVIHL